MSLKYVCNKSQWRYRRKRPHLANPTPLLSWSVSLNILVDITLPYLLSNASNFCGHKINIHWLEIVRPYASDGATRTDDWRLKHKGMMDRKDLELLLMSEAYWWWWWWRWWSGDGDDDDGQVMVMMMMILMNFSSWSVIDSSQPASFVSRQLLCWGRPVVNEREVNEMTTEETITTRVLSLSRRNACKGAWKLTFLFVAQNSIPCRKCWQCRTCHNYTNGIWKPCLTWS